jgi:hypothetical protein
MEKKIFALEELFIKIIFFAILIFILYVVIFCFVLCGGGDAYFGMAVFDGLFLVPFIIYYAFNFVKFGGE